MKPEAAAARPAGRALALALLVLIMAGAAAALFYVFKVDGPRAAAMATQMTEAERATTSLIAEVHAQREVVEALRQDQRQNSAQTGTFAAELARVAALAEAPRALDEDGLRLARLDHLLRSADVALRLARDPVAARLALEAAREDLLLTQPADKALSAAITEVLAGLDAAAWPPISSLDAEWAATQTGLEGLPVRAAPPPIAPAPVEGWSGVVGAIWRDLLGLVEIRKVEEADTALLDPARHALALAELRQEIGLMRGALWRRDTAAMRASVEVIAAELTRGFAPQAPEVAALQARLSVLRALELDPPLPSLAACLDSMPALHAAARAPPQPAATSSDALPAVPAASAAPPPTTQNLPPPARPRDIM